MSIRWPWKGRSLSVLLVCRANVCRSPMAEAILRHKLDIAGMGRRVQVASAGTHVNTGGQPPDPRVVAVLAENGIPVKRGRSHSIRSADFERHRFIIAMDRENLEHLMKICSASYQEKLHLVTAFSSGLPPEGIPDPYYGNTTGFEHVHELLETALDGFLDNLLLPALLEQEQENLS
ncbi:MAG: low molecular weight phosphotyrosine protein phosphatase [Gammaproteobacteria bacterium]|nr:MAG: low molecular weight phosphotyrosine protein phosphatase [Gammaproteobacteria bacterium]